jgi:acetyl-CoA acetyltransferase
MQREVYVVGGGLHPFGKFADTSMTGLARTAIWAAVEDSGCDPTEIGLSVVVNCYHGFFTGQIDAIAPIVIGRSGLSGMPMVHVMGGGASGSVGVHQGVMAVASGEYDLVLVVAAEKLYVPGDPAISITAIATSGEQDIATDLGLTWVGSLGMSSRELMKRYGWTASDFAKVASKNRQHAVANPYAEQRTPLSVEEVLAARVVADPLTRPMCASAAVDGAAAVLLASEEVARRLGNGRHPAFAGLGVVGGRYLSNREPDVRPGMLSMDEAPRAFSLAYERAGVGPDDLEIAQVHDSVAPEELLAYQVMGLAAPGDEPRLLREGATTLGGAVPFNTDGGLLARGHPIAASGVAQVVETMVQLRGTAGPERQVRVNGQRPPRIAAIQNAGAQGGPSGGVAVSAAMILTMDRPWVA